MGQGGGGGALGVAAATGEKWAKAGQTEGRHSASSALSPRPPRLFPCNCYKRGNGAPEGKWLQSGQTARLPLGYPGHGETGNAGQVTGNKVGHPRRTPVCRPPWPALLKGFLQHNLSAASASARPQPTGGFAGWPPHLGAPFWPLTARRPGHRPFFCASTETLPASGPPPHPPKSDQAQGTAQGH